jgi:hypothetical protein
MSMKAQMHRSDLIGLGVNTGKYVLDKNVPGSMYTQASIYDNY